MRWSYGARDIHHPFCHKRHVKWCANSVRVLTHVLSVPVRPSVDLNDDSREGVEGAEGMADRLRHPRQLSLVPRA